MIPVPGTLCIDLVHVLQPKPATDYRSNSPRHRRAPLHHTLQLRCPLPHVKSLLAPRQPLSQPLTVMAGPLADDVGESWTDADVLLMRLALEQVLSPPLPSGVGDGIRLHRLPPPTPPPL
jgi:hypothetical protein